MIEHSLLVVLDWKNIGRNINTVIIFSLHRNMTFYSIKVTKRRLFGGKGLYKTQTRKNNPFGNTVIIHKWEVRSFYKIFVARLVIVIPYSLRYWYYMSIKSMLPSSPLVPVVSVQYYSIMTVFFLKKSKRYSLGFYPIISKNPFL